MYTDLIHDLRMPLQLIQSSAQLLKLSLSDDTVDAAGCLDVMMENIAQLNRMLTGALAAGPTPAALDVVACLRGLCRRCGPRAAERGVALTMRQNVDALNVVADGELLSRAVLNLVMNALRFAPRGGTVAVRCEALGDFVEISVADDGPGIPPERLPYIFLRGETDGGSGYGLPAAMDCARAMGGDLSAISTPGGGSTFALRLPLNNGDKRMGNGKWGMGNEL